MSSQWRFDCCLLNEDRWPHIGCDIPKYGDVIPRFELSTPWFYLSMAFWSTGRFVKVKNYYPGMPPEEFVYKYHWFMFKRKTRTHES